jgi:hypothetical protein
MPRYYRHHCHPSQLSRSDLEALHGEGRLAFLAIPTPKGLYPYRFVIKLRSRVPERDARFLVDPIDEFLDAIEQKGLVAGKCDRAEDLYHLNAGPTYNLVKERLRERDLEVAMAR